MKTDESFMALYEVVKKLRSPEGCPWDREQTPSTLRGDLTEECFECIQAIDEKNPPHVAEELGDIFLLATMLSYMYEQEAVFTVTDVLTGITEKLIRRHPHVFGDVKVNDSAEVLANWSKIKVEQEGRKPKDSILDEVSQGLHPLDRAWKLQKKAAKAGFDWPDADGAAAKIREELEEVREAAGCLAHNGQIRSSDKLEEELGDLLFSAVNLCRYFNIEPSLALNRTNGKFVDRFRYVEKKMKETGCLMKKENLREMDKFWNEAKK